MSLYNVVPTHIRFNINMPVLTSKKQFKRSHVTTGETKKPKIFLRGPKLLDFLVFLRVFWFSNRNPKNHMFFLFSCSVSGEKTKNPVLFWDFCWKTKKHHMFFDFKLETTKNP